MSRLDGSIFMDDPPAKRQPTRAQYLNGEATHEHYYRAIAADAGVKFTGDRGRVKQALDAGDEHLNTIGLSAWDSYAYAALTAISVALRLHGDSWSLAGGVCVMKQAAKDAVR